MSSDLGDEEIRSRTLIQCSYPVLLPRASKPSTRANAIDFFVYVLGLSFHEAPDNTRSTKEAKDLNFVASPAVRRAIVAELRDNGIQDWADVFGRQIPAALIVRHMAAASRPLGAFVRILNQRRIYNRSRR